MRYDPAMDTSDRLFDDGYAIVRGVYAAHDLDALCNAFDEVRASAQQYKSSFRHGNTLYAIDEAGALRFVHWPAYVHERFESYRTDLRQWQLIQSVTGPDVKQIGNQATWKSPRSENTFFGWHQDARFRRPASAFRDLATSYVQVMIAVDPHTEESGCVQVLRGSHLRGDIDTLPVDKPIMQQRWDVDALSALGLDHADRVPLELEPGDVALWLPHTVHGSGPNRSAHDRRAYTNGYVRAANCDRGAWAFRGGQRASLGAPVLIQYDDLFRRPEPHHVDGTFYPVTSPPAD